MFERFVAIKSVLLKLRDKFRDKLNICNRVSKNDESLRDKKLFSIHLTKIQWVEIHQFNKGKERQSLNFSQISCFLNKEMENLNRNCMLKCKFNWLRKPSSQKQKAAYWRGLFTCTYDRCINEFVAIIQNDDDLKITMFQTGNFEHERLDTKKR